MSTDPTKYRRPLEPTQGVYYNPYEPTSPYHGNIPPPPPPPPKQNHKGLIVALILLSCLVVVLGGMLFAEMHLGTKQGVTQATPAPTLALTPTAIPASYTARDIIHDFVVATLSVGGLQYGVTASSFLDKCLPSDTQCPQPDFTVSPESSARFVDMTACTGACDTGGITWLGVYDTQSDAQTALIEIQQYVSRIDQYGVPFPPSLYNTQHGRCVLLAQPPSSGYVLVMNSNCT